jgi:hypothetical protein
MQGVGGVKMPAVYTPEETKDPHNISTVILKVIPVESSIYTTKNNIQD